MANVSACNIAPLAADFLVEGLECADTLLQFVQLRPLSLHVLLLFRRFFRVLALRLRLQLDNLPNQELGVKSVATDAGLYLIEASLESLESGKSSVLGRCARALELVPDGGILAENVAVANAEDLGARGAVLVLVLVEEQRDATLSISVLPLRSSDGHAECSSEEATDRRCGPDSFSTVPSYHSTTASSTLLALSRARMSREASCASLAVGESQSKSRRGRGCPSRPRRG